MSNERAGDADDVADKLRAEALALIEWAGADSWTGEVVRDLLAAQPAAAPDPEAVKRARIETAALLGWSTFGTHVDHPEVALEFAGDDGGVPEFERAVPDPEAPLRAKVEARLLSLRTLVEVATKNHGDGPLYSEYYNGIKFAADELRAVLGDSGALAEHDAKVWDEALRDAARDICDRNAEKGLTQEARHFGRTYARLLRERADRLAADAGGGS